MPHKKALILTANQGHFSIAMAVKSTLTQAGWQCGMVEENSRFISPFWEVYNLIYRYAPHLFGGIFELGQKPWLLFSGKIFMLSVNAHKILNELLVSRPDIIISTHFAYNPFLEVVARTTTIPIINIVSDPRTIHPMIVMPPPAINLVFDQAAAKYVKKLKPEAEVVVSGWFVRPQFYQLPTQPTLRQALHIPKNKFVITIVTGSTGTTSVLPLVKSLAKTMTNTYLLVVCGSNQHLQKSLSQVIVGPTNTLKVMGFTDQVGSLMKAADLVVGKAGPNMLFETVAVNVPFFASTYISGQESGNIEIIEHYKLGVVQTSVPRAVKQILELQAKPQLLHNFESHIQTMAKHNRQSEKVLIQLAEKLSHQTTAHHRLKFLNGSGLLPRFIRANLHQPRKS